MIETVERKQWLRALMLMVFFLGSASVVGILFDLIGFPETNIVIIYLFSVILISRFTLGYAYGITASITATLLFNYLFTVPYYTLTVDNPSYFITFGVMVTTAVITSALTIRTNQNKQHAEEREKEAKALYSLTSRLTDAVDISQIISISIHIISEVLDCQAACVPFDHKGEPAPFFLQEVGANKQVKIELKEPQELKDQILNLRNGYDASSEDFHDWPIYGQDHILGVMRIPTENARALDHTHKRLLLSMIENTALAMERVYLAEERLKSREETTQERHRGNLLRGISHDLRTPLSGIMATSEMLKEMTDSEDSRYSMMEAINNDAIWLHSLVENVLSLTKLQDGRLILKKEKEALEEIIDEAVRQIKKRSPNQRITVSMPNELILIPMDSKLIMQVFINLLENAIKHNPSAAPVDIEVQKDSEAKEVTVSISDQGQGIDENDLENIFQPFYTSSSKHADAYNRTGLGLAICDSVIKAHGGQIEARNKKDKGAELIFTLPLEGEPNGKAE
ncbi:Osmosensitive K+ channel histidine kinase KdpD [Alkalibacterium sp. AK22]|uniref:ATP-binding protein n=1 Tax=Alkalibacterium sp. AK22 TaxID=1229520 RepID=UPI00044B8ADE|nr:ATP-binding protein [Alkalibacterium sp. AK22]EXJ22665.1 Osmosensitive K+ channel histidine kinase KdpD [Alkalibacterium sp. AK22]